MSSLATRYRAPTEDASRAESIAEQAEPYLPDFCQPRVALAVVLVAELVAIALALARHNVVQDFWVDLARSSLFMVWVGLCGAFVMCRTRPFMHGMTAARISAVSFLLLLGTAWLIAEATYWVGQYALRPLGTGQSSFFPSARWPFLLGTLGITAIVSALMLRYFYVIHQWRRNVEMQARARVSALQARIRPHFLFNSMNTIAALTRSDPDRAEEAVEDLAELFRASLRDAGQRIRLHEELDMARVYQRIEQLRLGDRLTVDWNVQALPQQALIPALTLQPLLENAIYHGIEPLTGGGTVTVDGTCVEGIVQITVTNPVGTGAELARHQGNRMALANISERLQLAHGERGSLLIQPGDTQFQVTLRFPLEDQRE